MNNNEDTREKLASQIVEGLDLDTMSRHAWDPGNGTRYDLLLGKDGTDTLLCWMRHGGSGGVCIRWDADIDCMAVSYFCEKMQCNEADAVAILAFLDMIFFKVAYNCDLHHYSYYLDHLRRAHNLSITDGQMKDPEGYP